KLFNPRMTKRRMRLTVAACVVLSLPSCGIPPLRPSAPGPGLPASFNGVVSPDNSGQLPVEEFYRDPLLTGLIRQAIVGNQELRIRNETVRIASNEILARQGAYIPFIYPGASAGLDRYSKFTLPGAGIRDDPFAPN